MDVYNGMQWMHRASLQFHIFDFILLANNGIDSIISILFFANNFDIER